MKPSRSLIEFSRRLRTAGIAVGATHAVDLADSLVLVDPSSGDDVYWAFKALSVVNHDQEAAFNRVFLEMFGGGSTTEETLTVQVVPRTWSISLDRGEAGESGDEEADEGMIGASLVERLWNRDFAELGPEEENQVRSLIARMIWNPGLTVSRRRAPAHRGDHPDLRRTLRHGLGVEGDLLRIATNRRKPRRRPLIFIADVSGSMERYSEMLLYFAHSAQDRLGRLEAFVFSTHLTRITRQLDRRRPSEAIARVSQAVHDWSGGTRIGESLRTFNREWSRRVVRGGPIALIVSDGWDRGEPELLAMEMAHLHRTMHRVIWLNPLAGREGYAPETRGMQAAWPHIDNFLSAANLRDLKTLIELLEAVR